MYTRVRGIVYSLMIYIHFSLCATMLCACVNMYNLRQPTGQPLAVNCSILTLLIISRYLHPVYTGPQLIVLHVGDPTNSKRGNVH